MKYHTNIIQKISLFLKEQISLLLEPIIGHSRAVSFAKIALLCAALILTAILIIFPIISPVNKNFRLTFSSMEKGVQGEAPKMINPHLQGIYGKNQTYNVNAQMAIQETQDTMRLLNITANLSLTNDGQVSAKADEGVINHEKNTMDLSGNINIFNDENYQFSTDNLHIDIKKISASGSSTIQGQGPAGTIHADNFLVEDKGNRILLQGNVKVVIFSIEN